MRLWPRRRKQPTVRYWVNGYGPFDTAAERDQMHAMLKEIDDHNRRHLAILEVSQRERPTG